MQVGPRVDKIMCFRDREPDPFEDLGIRRIPFAGAADGAPREPWPRKSGPNLCHSGLAIATLAAAFCAADITGWSGLRIF